MRDTLPSTEYGKRLSNRVQILYLAGTPRYSSWYLSFRFTGAPVALELFGGEEDVDNLPRQMNFPLTV